MLGDCDNGGAVAAGSAEEAIAKVRAAYLPLKEEAEGHALKRLRESGELAALSDSEAIGRLRELYGETRNSNQGDTLAAYDAMVGAPGQPWSERRYLASASRLLRCMRDADIVNLDVSVWDDGEGFFDGHPDVVEVY